VYSYLTDASCFTPPRAESARKNGAKETAALWQPTPRSRQAEAALSLTPGRDVRVLAAMALARAGNSTLDRKDVDLHLDLGRDANRKRFSLVVMQYRSSLWHQVCVKL